LLATCACSSTLTIEELEDASFCRGCGRMLRAEPKVATPTSVYCAPCARRGEHAIPHPVRRYMVGS
jgi:hypothetical protein